MKMTHIVGTCGRCGGPVELPDVWMGIYPPTPTCRQCGATAKENHGQKLDMDDPPITWTDTFTRHAAAKGADHAA